GALTFLVLWLWLMFAVASGFAARFVVLLLPVLLGAGGWLLVREVNWSAAMVPTFTFRWNPVAEEQLESHRAQAAAAAKSIADNLDGDGPNDCPEFRGRKRDGAVSGPALPRDWSKTPPRRLWRQPVGDGHSSFAVVGPVAFTLEQRRDAEVLV